MNTAGNTVSEIDPVLVLKTPQRRGASSRAAWVAWAKGGSAVGNAELVEQVLTMNSKEQRSFAYWAAHEAVALAGLAEAPAVRAIYASEFCAATSAQRVPPDLMQLMCQEQLGKFAGGRKPGALALQRARALEALHIAIADPESESAAIHALVVARFAHADGKAAFVRRSFRVAGDV